MAGPMSDKAKVVIRSLIGESLYGSLAAVREQVRGYVFLRGDLGRKSQTGLRALQGRYTGRRCFVIGNGPSLKRLDLTKLRNEVTIGSNGLFLIFKEMGFVPTIYTIEDRLVANERCHEADAISGTTKIYPVDFRGVLADGPDTLWLNFRRAYRPFPRFSERLDETVYWGGTVSFLNLQIAFWLGCPQIYLIGFDHSYTIPDSADVTGKVITSREDDPNHFHPDYFGRGYRWHDPNVARMEDSYRLAQQHFLASGKKVMNATTGGKLEVFPRCSYDDLF